FENSFENIDIKLEGKDASDPNYSILTLNPLSEKKDKITFFQGSFLHESGRYTLNTGLGYRYITPSEDWIFGVNFFHDLEINQGHRRISLGGEIKGPIDINLNKYLATSDTKYDNDTAETALDGHEIEIGGQIPYIPSTKLFLKSWKWEGSGGVADTKGNTYSLEMNSLVSPNLMLEAGIKDYDDTTQEDVNFVSLTYRLKIGDSDKNAEIKSFISDKAFETSSIRKRLKEKVRRKNKIVVQKGFVSRAGGV
ncbi:inverse autotransporter beta domain-containing protein, partial [Alphaproteobacteria bacterium]|nr:inverse autotransporter beta domain-containing protein [Alphaproteobacteria bacterium]